MSLPYKANIQCPKCAHNFSYTAWDTINTAHDPNLPQKIISGEFFSFRCPNCGYTGKVEYPMLYHDLKHRAMIWLVPKGDNYDDKVAEIRATQVPPGIRTRIVDSSNALREKVSALEAGKDDCIIELLKIVMSAQAEDDHPGFIAERAYYSSRTGKETIEIYNDSGDVKVACVDSELYEHYLFLFEPTLKSLSIDSFATIDEAWASEKLQKIYASIMHEAVANGLTVEQYLAMRKLESQNALLKAQQAEKNTVPRSAPPAPKTNNNPQQNSTSSSEAAKPRTGLLVTGIILLVFQLISMSGNAKTDSLPWQRPGFFSDGGIGYDLTLLLGYFLVGIIGIILIIIALSKKRPTGEKHAENPPIVSLNELPKSQGHPMYKQPTPEKEKPVAAKPEVKQIKKRFCKYCGGPIDSDSKKCLYCGKQYFRIAKKAIIAILVVAVILLAVLNIYQFVKNSPPAENLASSPAAPIVEATPSPTPSPAEKPSGPVITTPITIDVVGKYYYSSGIFHSREHCSKLTGEYTSGYWNGKMSPDFAPCSTCIIMESENISNGTILDGDSYDLPYLAPLTIEASGSQNYYIFLDCIDNHYTFNTDTTEGWIDSLRNGDPNIAFYVKKGQSAEILVPLGEYEIYYACGDTWYGEKYKFGPFTTYHKCEGTFDFYDDGTYYQGWTLELYEQVNGNMDTEEIDADDFPG